MSDFHILYLDKDSFIAGQVKMRLEWKDYRITTADSEKEFLSNIAQHHYDLLIIDFSTPTLNAFFLLADLKAQNITYPTIIVNANNDPQLISKALQLGCLDYVIKDPIIKNYTDQLSYSLFQSIAKLQINRIQEKNTRQTTPRETGKTLPKIVAPILIKTSWEYFLSNKIVHWFPTQDSTQKTITYKEFLSKIHIDDLAIVKTKNNICLYSRIPVQYSFRYLADDHKITIFHANLKADVDKKGVVTRLYGHLQTNPTEQETDQNLQLKLSFLEHTEDAIFIADDQNKIISINNAFTTLSGLSEQDILTKETNILNTEQYDAQFFNNIAKELKKKHYWQGEASIRHQNGQSIPVWQSTYILKDDTDNIHQSISVLRDISEQKATEKSIKLQANYDVLTQLPNRTLFRDRLSSAVKQTQRSNKKMALMLLDLNKFKWINDTFGHHIGDGTLQETAKKLLSAVRESDTVARLGGDEFCIILPDLEKTTDAELIARKIFNSFKKAITVEQQEIHISGSIGIAIFPEDGQDIGTLQKNADSAMYMAKNSGENKFYYYTHALQQKTEKRLKLIADMHSAITNKEFILYYQPIIDLQSNKVTGAETLLRWIHPEIGYIPLSEFIPLAEESGLIHEIGNWVINEVANNMQRWSSLALSPINISLNQSATQYSQHECHIKWLNILEKKQVSPDRITFEIPEKIFIDGLNGRLKSIEKLKQAGIQISLDSFGTGYTSLNYLKKLPFDTIKIDRSYIHNMIDDPTDAILVESIIVLANKLGIKVIATGVESQQQLDLLHLLDQQCRYVQGYYFSKPLPLNEFEQFIKEQNEA